MYLELDAGVEADHHAVGRAIIMGLRGACFVEIVLADFLRVRKRQESSPKQSVAANSTTYVNGGRQGDDMLWYFVLNYSF